MARRWAARLRLVHGDEAQKASTFWALHPSRFLDPRPVETLREVAAQGLLVVVEVDGHWAACTASFPVRSLPFIELSDTRVVEGLAGFHLQPDVLTPIRVATALGGEFGDELIQVIDRTNDRSRKNAAACGFVPWTDAPDEALVALELTRDDPTYELLHLPLPDAADQVKRLLSRIDEHGTILLTRGDDTMTVTLDVPLIQDADLREALERMIAELTARR